MFAEAEAEAKDETPSSEEFLLETWCFQINAKVIIKKMKELNDSYQGDGSPSRFVDEILHSIFFLGRINKPRISPQRLVNDDTRFKELKEHFPRPFELYSSHLPRRSPFSCVLDMIVFREGRENENEIKKKLQEIISEVHLKQTERHKESKLLKESKNLEESERLVSSTICVSQNTENPVPKYYGVSMSPSGRVPGRIMVAASCLSGYWDPLVAGAVMSFTPNKSKNSDFDGTFKMPKPVTCQAYSLHKGEEKPPCDSCKNLFYEGHFENVRNTYGHCAEVESVSKMFKKEEGVREKAQPTSEKFTDENRRKAEESVRAVLKNLPKTFKSKGHYQFYTPSEQMKGGNIGH